MKLFQFIALSDDDAQFNVKSVASKIWSEDMESLGVGELAATAREAGKKPAVVSVVVADSAIDWVATRSFREETPGKKQIKLYPGQQFQHVTLVLI